MNATLAGGVAIGTCSSLILPPVYAMLVGGLAGIVSALGYLHLTLFLQERMGLYDTCGVHHLHGMPGIIGGVAGAFSCAFSESAFRNKRTNEVPYAMIHNIFPALIEKNNERTV